MLVLCFPQISLTISVPLICIIIIYRQSLLETMCGWNHPLMKLKLSSWMLQRWQWPAKQEGIFRMTHSTMLNQSRKHKRFYCSPGHSHHFGISCNWSAQNNLFIIFFVGVEFIPDKERSYYALKVSKYFLQIKKRTHPKSILGNICRKCKLVQKSIIFRNTLFKVKHIDRMMLMKMCAWRYVFFYRVLGKTWASNVTRKV